MNNYDKQYQALLFDVMLSGVKKLDRTGVGTVSKFGHLMRLNMAEGFPLSTTKKIHTKAVVHELLWFLQGGDNIKYLVDNDVRIWNEWPWQRYCNERKKREEQLAVSMKHADHYDGTPFEVKTMKDRLDEMPELTLKAFAEKIKLDDEFAKEWGKLGPVYGKQWIEWKGYTEEEPVVNQIQNLVNDLKNNPDSRRHLVTAWNPAQIKDAVLPPCHWAFQCWTRELTVKEREAWYDKHGENGTGKIKLVAFIVHESKDVQDDKEVNKHYHEFLDGEGVPRRALSLMFQMRSVDCFLGMPFDIASYGILLHMLAQVTGMIPDELLMATADTHIYLNHFDQVKEQLSRTPYKLPTLVLNPEIKNITDFRYDDIEFINYECHPAIKADVAI